MKLEVPISADKLKDLKYGDVVYITGTIYTARDAAHKRLFDLLDEGKELPIPIKDQFIYYTGPAETKPGDVIGVCGPTTAYRMDPFAPKLLQMGLSGMIAKGKRSQEVKDAIKEYGGLYFAATGGAAALLAECVKKSEIVAFEDLGAEAIRKLEVENFPVIVINDSHGGEKYVTFY